MHIIYLDNYYKTNFPTDSDGKPCAYGDHSAYPYIFFPDINNVHNVNIFIFREFVLQIVHKILVLH